MDDRRAPNLEAMDQREASRLLNELASDLSPEGEYQIRHPEAYVMEMPQSGERIRGRENMRAFQAAFGQAAPAMKLRRVLVREGLWVAEVVSDYDGRVFHYVSMVELEDGKMWRDTRYYAEPFEAPEWRTHLVERTEARR